jgi:hypothetical protein
VVVATPVVVTVPCWWSRERASKSGVRRRRIEEQRKGTKEREGGKEAHYQSRRGDGSGTCQSRSGRGSRRSGRSDSGSLLAVQASKRGTSRENRQFVVRKKREGHAPRFSTSPPLSATAAATAGMGTGAGTGEGARLATPRGFLRLSFPAVTAPRETVARVRTERRWRSFIEGYGSSCWLRRREEVSEEKEETERGRTWFWSH